MPVRDDDAWASAALACRVGGHPDLIEEGQVVGIRRDLALAPSRTCRGYVLAALLIGMKRLF
jgi:hypothetical protein